MRPLLLDLFCGAGGAAKGYHDAGFDIIGVDNRHQPNYPFPMMVADALHVMERLLDGHYIWPSRAKEPIRIRDVAAVHASPPCQAKSTQTADRSKHEWLLPDVRELLSQTVVPYVIENVEGARRDMIDPVRLCGSSFGLDVRRHRYFEANWPLVGRSCDHAWQTPRFRSLAIKQHRAGRLASVVGVHGHINYPGEFPLRCAAMGIGWMTNDELVESIPPAYTRWIGEQLMDIVDNRPQME
jgi:DNA (cytosine-5)-methyltransferase 1